MKIYFVCWNEGNAMGMYCQGMLENGFCFGSHLCSLPGYARGDLYFHRKNRIEALKKIFDITPESVQEETIVISNEEEIPEWYKLAASEEVQATLKPLYERYSELTKELTA